MGNSNGWDRIITLEDGKEGTAGTKEARQIIRDFKIAAQEYGETAQSCNYYEYLPYGFREGVKDTLENAGFAVEFSTFESDHSPSGKYTKLHVDGSEPKPGTEAAEAFEMAQKTLQTVNEVLDDIKYNYIPKAISKGEDRICYTFYPAQLYVKSLVEQRLQKRYTVKKPFERELRIYLN